MKIYRIDSVIFDAAESIGKYKIKFQDLFLEFHFFHN